VLKRALDNEMADYLGYERGDPAGAGSGNSRHGRTTKAVLTDVGSVDITVSGDGNGTFEPPSSASGSAASTGSTTRSSRCMPRHDRA
jgi:transposase-like protein